MTDLFLEATDLPEATDLQEPTAKTLKPYEIEQSTFERWRETNGALEQELKLWLSDIVTAEGILFANRLLVFMESNELKLADETLIACFSRILEWSRLRYINLDSNTFRGVSRLLSSIQNRALSDAMLDTRNSLALVTEEAA